MGASSALPEDLRDDDSVVLLPRSCNAVGRVILENVQVDVRLVLADGPFEEGYMVLE